MPIKKIRVKFYFLLCFLSISCITNAQSDSTAFNQRSLIVPSVLVGYGIFGTYTDIGDSINRSIQSTASHTSTNDHLDDFVAITPVAAVYGLNLCGIKGKHNFKDRTIIIGTSYAILLPVVYGTKAATGILRPDGSAYTAFPSGHTAVAFAGAEFLRQEYKHRSPWYGIAGYTIATATAGLRVYNNKHWAADVAAGAGLGILSTQAAYLIHPWMAKKFFSKKNASVSIAPTITSDRISLSFSARF